MFTESLSVHTTFHICRLYLVTNFSIVDTRLKKHFIVGGLPIFQLHCWLASLYIILCESQTMHVILWLWVLFPVIPIGTYLVVQFLRYYKLC